MTATLPEESGASVGIAEQVQQIPLSRLRPFEGHPFKVQDDDAMAETVESIKQIGVVVPLIARPMEDGSLEIIAGHRRHHAAQLAGLESVPVLVREMDRDAAVIFMVDSNLQRENILPSEKAWAYRMKIDAIDRIKGRPQKECQVGTDYFGKRTMEIVGEDGGDSARQVDRYVRLTNLIPEIMDMVDSREISFNPAVELSYLKPEEQKDFLSAMDYAQAAPSLSQAQRMKKMSQEGSCDLDAMCEVMNEVKKSDMGRVSFSTDSLKRFFPKSYTPKQMEDTILRLLEQWQRKRQRDMER
ncbi:MAG: ParB/RepB/Spo0J family partition protein [Lachnospiraceae bacterium]|nr:ParB/RepB/Spo0J family partition protein [Lachnospiraceae bacterium]